MSTDGELWHIVEAKRDDGTPTMFRIRELDPLRHLDKIFVVEMPYPATEMSRLPSASAYRRLSEFDDKWLRPACTNLGWELVGSKTEDGSFFLYMYGSGDPNELIARLSPFDANLGFYDDADPDWAEYGTLRELLDQAKAIPKRDELEPEAPPAKKKAAPAKKPAANAKAKKAAPANAKKAAPAKAKKAAPARAKKPAAKKAAAPKQKAAPTKKPASAKNKPKRR